MLVKRYNFVKLFYYIVNYPTSFVLKIVESQEKPLYFENFDLDSVVMPVNVNELRKLLEETGYDKDKSKFLIDGFTSGFSIGYEGPTDIKITSKNLRLDGGIGDKTILWNKVMKEVELKRYAGPFAKIPFTNFIQSPIGLVPKDNGKSVHLIFHLSHPRGENSTSVNANSPAEKCKVVYPDFNKAIQLCIKAGRFCKLLKSDMSAAFRNLGIKKQHWRYLILKAESPIDGKEYFFIDKCMPFGASISCANFQAFSDSISHVVKIKSGGMENLNYLDDFLFIALLRALCNGQLELFLAICKRINFPVSIEKTFHADSQMTFLGFLIDA